ncbi:hypothetical protein [Paenibacillus sp. FSL M7-1046]|uniref:hypothetical protein n=1 Tax=Paenibacillus sp. FSL M7-1046 TaxID=2975315 RepID=UPI0030FCEF49
MTRASALNLLSVSLVLVKERIRRASFLWTIVVFACCTYYYFPASDTTGSLTTVIKNSLLDGHYRGTYNSVWMGLLVVLFFNCLLLFGGIFLIRNSIGKDVTLQLEMYYTTSPLNVHQYAESKRLANFLYLALVAMAVEVMALIMQLCRGESYAIEPLSYIVPFVLLILPFIYVLSSVTVCMELLPPLRRNLGNLLLFILSYAYLSIIFAGANKTEINPYFDVTGLQFIVKNVFSQFRQYFALTRPNDPSISFFETIGDYNNTFQMYTMTWEFKFVISRIVIVLVAFIFMHLLVALTSYERIFGTSRTRVKPAKANRSSARKLAKSLVPVNPAYTAPAPEPFKAQFISIIPYELKIAFRGSEKLMLLVLPLLAAQYFPSIDSLHAIGFRLASLMPLFILSGSGFHKQEAYIYATVAYKNKYYFSKIIMYMLLLALFFSGTLFNLFVHAQYAGILSLIVGITFAVASASLTVVVPPNLFNVLYILMWYMGIIQKIEVLNVYSNSGNGWITGFYGAAALLMMVFSYKKI